ncbi:MAG: 6-carboxytetrahydropterin synthase [Candidatus Solibacter usitatus]|nr:6-carboxytetrahydropterin synthase [Candidatus Solibacter usitatus]
MKITRRAEFSASHYCSSPALSAEQNAAVYGNGANPHGHGHNYVLEVTLDGTPDPVTGMVMDLKVLKEILNDEVVHPMDHRFLNREVPPFDHIVPTPENIAREIWRRLSGKLNMPNARLHSVRIYETEDLWVEYAE